MTILVIYVSCPNDLQLKIYIQEFVLPSALILIMPSQTRNVVHFSNEDYSNYKCLHLEFKIDMKIAIRIGRFQV